MVWEVGAWVYDAQGRAILSPWDRITKIAGSFNINGNPGSFQDLSLRDLGGQVFYFSVSEDYLGGVQGFPRLTYNPANFTFSWDYGDAVQIIYGVY